MLIGMLRPRSNIRYSLANPVSYALSPESGIIMLAGVYYGAIFGVIDLLYSFECAWRRGDSRDRF